MSKRRHKQTSRQLTFEDFRSDFNRMFFSPTDVVSAGTVEHANFWKFLKKYCDMEERSNRESMPTKEIEVKFNSRGIPTSYNSESALLFRLSASVDELAGKLPPKDEDEECLPQRMLIRFKLILDLYLNYLQREKFTKLRKLREAQGNLPIAAYQDAIISAITENPVVVIAGDTGCGKSTQVPQYLLRAGFQQIACTQPRRIACISLSKRVAYETLNEYGTSIGYQIRFERKKTQHTITTFITEGLLLRQVSADPLLSQYNVIVLDEVHERHLHSDFLLGVMKCLLMQRHDLKVILMSATINIQLYQNYFGAHTPVIQVPGRLYPIQLQYRAISPEMASTKSGRLNPTPYIQVMQLIDAKYPDNERGDLLIFLSGTSEISAVVDAAKIYAQQTNRWIVLPLHSMLSLAEQDKIFDYPPDGIRKCIVSTNIAETSVTIDGVRFVVDSGKVKEMMYDPETRMQRLKEFWISRASAEQRKGRAGRTGPGVCFRMYSEQEYNELEPYSTPEIQRVPLDSLILQMISIGLPDARKFPFVEPPVPEALENAVESLKNQSALTFDEKLTAMGKMLSRLPVDVTIGKMLIMGSVFRQMDPVLSLAAVLSVQNPLTNKAYRDSDCMAARRRLDSDHGDPITLFNAFRGWLEEKSDHRGESRKWCRRRGLEEQRFYEATKLRQQFKDLLQDAGLLNILEAQNQSSADRAARHGELKHLRSQKREYHNSAPRRRKLLRLDEGDVERDEENEDEIDIKDVEFRLSNNRDQVKELLRQTTAFTYKDLMTMKVILCSGLYPHFAVADEFNSYKSDADQLFHTPTKSFVALHPMGIFANQPDILRIDGANILKGSSKYPVSNKHQLLCYMSLLETTKPYLMNTFRMPAAQTLLLFSRSLDTDERFSRIVCDSWIELQFPNLEHAESLLFKSAQIRDMWEDLLAKKLNTDKMSAESEDFIADTDRLEKKLFRLLLDFLHIEVFYSMKRLLAADVKTLYTGVKDSEKKVFNPFAPERPVQHNPFKGGWKMTDYITYKCLVETDSVSQDYMSTSWVCTICDETLYMTGLERIEHISTCQLRKEKDDESQASSSKSASNPYEKSYFCPQCNKELFLKPTDILRHKRLHSTGDN